MIRHDVKPEGIANIVGHVVGEVVVGELVKNGVVDKVVVVGELVKNGVVDKVVGGDGNLEVSFESGTTIQIMIIAASITAVINPTSAILYFSSISISHTNFCQIQIFYGWRLF